MMICPYIIWPDYSEGDTAEVVYLKGLHSGCAIHICRTPASSAAIIDITATAALAPSMISPTRSRIGRELEAT